MNTPISFVYIDNLGEKMSLQTSLNIPMLDNVPLINLLFDFRSTLTLLVRARSKEAP